MPNIQLADGTWLGRPSNECYPFARFRDKSTGELINGRCILQEREGGYLDLIGYLKIGRTFKECKQYMCCEVEEYREGKVKINVIDEDTGVHDMDKLYAHQQFAPDEFVRYAGTVWRVACINGGYAHIVHDRVSKRVHLSLLEKIGCEVNDDPYPHE